MTGIIQKIANEPVTIKQRVKIVDGKPEWGNEINALAFQMSFTKADASIFGAIQNGKIFLVAPTSTKPELPAIIIYNGKEYTVKAIKTYRNMKNILIGYRIAVSGA